MSNSYYPAPYPVYPYYGKETKTTEQLIAFPPQHQAHQPGLQYVMKPLPIVENPSYKSSGKLKHKVAIISGGDSGIGCATAIAFAKEGAAVAIAYLEEQQDAETTKARIEQLGGQCLLLRADLRIKANNYAVVDAVLSTFGRLDILVNNLGAMYPKESILEISEEQLVHTFQTNVFSYFFMTQAALPHLKRGASIINTASITAYTGEKTLIDYTASKGAVAGLTRALSLSFADLGIRVNAVAPGPVWTPLIPSSFSPERVSIFGTDTPMKRAGQPFELAPAYVYLASDDSAYVTGETIHVNGGGFITA